MTKFIVHTPYGEREKVYTRESAAVRYAEKLLEEEGNVAIWEVDEEGNRELRDDLL